MMVVIVKSGLHDTARVGDVPQISKCFNTCERSHYHPAHHHVHEVTDNTVRHSSSCHQVNQAQRVLHLLYVCKHIK